MSQTIDGTHTLYVAVSTLVRNHDNCSQQAVCQTTVCKIIKLFLRSAKKITIITKLGFIFEALLLIKGIIA